MTISLTFIFFGLEDIESVICSVQDYNTMTRLGVELRPLDRKSTALNTASAPSINVKNAFSNAQKASKRGKVVLLMR